MLSVQGSGHRFCDGVSRRSFLQIGGLGLGGLTLADLMRAQSQATGGASGDTKNKAVIMIYLAGGVSHQDWVDLKPDAPAAVRGEFNPIATNVPGIEICELAPRMAKMMPTSSPSSVRSPTPMVPTRRLSAGAACVVATRSRMQQPSIGSFLAKELGSAAKRRCRPSWG